MHVGVYIGCMLILYDASMVVMEGLQYEVMSCPMQRRSRPSLALHLRKIGVLAPIAGRLAGRRCPSPEGGRYGREHLYTPPWSGSFQRQRNPSLLPNPMVARR